MNDRGTDAQILKERELTASAIRGAIAFGQQGINPPPTSDHWLAPFWNLGRSYRVATGEVDAEAAIKFCVEKYGYHQGTKACIAFYRGACWQSLQSFGACDGCYDSDDCHAFGCARRRT